MMKWYVGVFLVVLSQFALGESQIAPSCESLSDSFCELLWDDAHRGNVTIGSEKILLGNSSKSDL